MTPAARKRRWLLALIPAALVLLLALLLLAAPPAPPGAPPPGPAPPGPPGAPPQVPPHQPAAPVADAADLIVIEDFVAVQNGRYYVSAETWGTYFAVPLWGGWATAGNITRYTLAVRLKDAGGPDATLLIFGVASRRGALDQDLGNGFRVVADESGGRVTYNETLAAWCLRHVSGDGVHAWIPARTCGAAAKYVITVVPESGAVYINGAPVPAYNVTLVKIGGVLPGWLVTASQSGTYCITAWP